MSRSDAMGDQILTDIEILHETTGAEGTEIHVWIKNVGCKEISSGMITDSDLFFGEAGNFERIPYDENGSSGPAGTIGLNRTETRTGTKERPCL